MTARHLALLLLLGGCPTSSDDDDTTTVPCPDGTDPEVLAGSVEDPQPEGFPVQVVAQVTDEDGINSVSLYYRTTGAANFQFVFMSNENTGDETIYVAEIPGSAVRRPGVEFYVRAVDREAPCAREGFFPEGAPDDVLSFPTATDTTEVPFRESWEGVDCEEGTLEDAGWVAHAQSFQEGVHNFRLDDRDPVFGGCFVSHSEGVPGFWDCPPPEGEGNIERKNWLISPPLDLRGKKQVFVHWQERAVAGGPCAEVHRLYISAGSPNPDEGADPATGDFLLVSELPLPGGEWAGSGWYDISQYATAETAYLALYYQGGVARRWQVDDFYVGEPLADIVLEAAGPLDGSVGPGSSVSLDITVRNASATYAAEATTATLTTSDAGISITAATSTYPPLPAGQAAANDGGSFGFDVLGSHPDNAYLDFALELADAAGHTWSVPIRLLMGEESSVSLSVTDGGAPLVVTMGNGPPSSPVFALSSTSDAWGGAPWVENVTEQAAKLPPGAGSRRWFVTVENGGPADASVDAWTFEVGGIEYGAPGLPAVVPAGGAITIRYPEPPLLAVDSVATTPDPAAPGGAVTLEEVVLRNDGAATSGIVRCVLDSSDPDASGFSSSLIAFGVAAIPTGGTAASTSPTAFTLGGGHNQDEPLALLLLCSDGTDSIAVPFEIEVPYAHPVVDAIAVDDDCVACDGNGDGYADPGETVELRLVARNAGSLPTGGALTAVASVSALSTAPFVVLGGGTTGFGATPIAAGDTATAASPILVEVDAAARMGDTMLFDVVFEAASDAWDERAGVDVTAIPWLPCPAAEDAEGDEVSGVGFDLRGCDYRSDDTLLQIRVSAWRPFDPSTQSLWMFVYEVPSLYSVEYVPPAPAVLESGCVGGDDLATSIPIQVDMGTGEFATVRIAVDDLYEIGHNLLVGFAAGYCLGFCDVWPQAAAQWLPTQNTLYCSETNFVQLNW
jgi:hypothetical protein